MITGNLNRRLVIGVAAAGLLVIHLSLGLRSRGSGGGVRAQFEPTIRHDEARCLPNNQFSILGAVIQPGAEIRSAKLYFRSEQYPDFYYVEMTRSGDSFQAILPKPAPETRRVIYYIEAVDRLFSSARTEENDPEVRRDSECSEAWFTGPTPKIIVHSLATGLPAAPPGFLAAGVAAAGGLGAGTAVIVGAGAAGAVTGVVVTTGGDDDGETTTTSVPGGGPSPTTTTAGPTTTVSTTTSTVGPTTTVSTTTTTGPTTSVSSTTTTTVPPQVKACFTAKKNPALLPPCTYNFNASCSQGSIVQYQWFFQGNPPLFPDFPQTTTSPTVSYSWSFDPACLTLMTFGRTVRLTVLAGTGQTDTTQQVIMISYLSNPFWKASELRTSFSSFLGVGPFDGEARGQVLLNGARLDATDSRVPARHNLAGHVGGNTVEAYVVASPEREGFWRFDFTGSDHFVAGSLKVEWGQVISLDARSVVFRLSGAPGERIKFSYILLP